MSDAVSAKTSASSIQKMLKLRPARVQVDPETAEDDRPAQTGTTFNIWYLKWAGGDSTHTFVKSKTRCITATDTGYTRGDRNSGSFLCYFFAKGCCHLGKKCEYLHRIPSSFDSFAPTLDCFGREKTADYRDDMSGVGSFNKINRTLYVSNLEPNSKHLETTLNKHFGEWGKIERMRVIHSKNIAFVTFTTELAAQFAKEAMANQLLDGNEILSIKWANQDPNPEAQQREKRQLEQQAVETVKQLLGSMDEPAEKKQRLVIEDVEEVAPVVVESAGLFDKSSLEVLKQLQALKRQAASSAAVSVGAPKSMGELLGGYDSSDDEQSSG
ncbi:hypothetical protein BABINDRAFT_158931 [Babjeviella inositovora NRRL Y-12698]|uniref:Pre-mRNA-splicing factor CWC2 n=1 Tax=Babjeviella inositovora NRRL Y-12698 TaxID=984486 RepID=A0A1E3QX90_9ASCO|nr:uncharacterized protein BABINDRAFT_158931 [Babjeviella inositovora NRRL Y-12698]ODQ82309.1 hypothetical protein BABINDRAFT_158931 [Babjeviella inositovora NRRL Y-12698]